MHWTIYLLIYLASFALMEGVAWFTHKYIMHGFLWQLHKDHHQQTDGPFEWNDFFAVLFAAIAITFCVLGLPQADWKFWVGAGITSYGIAYFLVHDVFVHRRIKLFGKPFNRYFKALRKAHRIHHKTLTKHGAESFGFLFVSKKYFPKKSNHSRTSRR